MFSLPDFWPWMKMFSYLISGLGWRCFPYLISGLAWTCFPYLISGLAWTCFPYLISGLGWTCFTYLISGLGWTCFPYLISGLGYHRSQLLLSPQGRRGHVLGLVTLVWRQLAVQADADVTLAAVEAKGLARMELAQLVANSAHFRLGRWLGRNWLHAMVTCAGDPVMQMSTGTTHALLAVATGVRGFLLLALLTHLTQHRSAARGVFGVVHVPGRNWSENGDGGDDNIPIRWWRQSLRALTSTSVDCLRGCFCRCLFAFGDDALLKGISRGWVGSGKCGVWGWGCEL